VDIDEVLREKAPMIDNAIEKYLPRHFSERAFPFKLNPPRYSYNLEALNKAIAEPVWDLLDRGGKRWRPVLFLTICEALGKNPEDYLEFSIIPEVVHNGTLMVDDVEDGSELRRGKPCTHKLYGVDAAINAGNSMYYVPLLALRGRQERFSPEILRNVYEVYVEEMVNLSFGQAMDIAWHKGLAYADQIGELDYMQMCAYKTGALARMAAKMAAVLAGANNDLSTKIGNYAEAIGVAFQIQDDILDITSRDFAEKKGGKGQDITEGKRSLIVIHTLQVASTHDRKRLIEILNMHTQKQKLRDEAILLMEKYGSIGYSKKCAINMIQDSWIEIDPYLENSIAKMKLKSFADFLVKRNK